MTLEKESSPLMPAAGSGRIRAHVQLPESEPESPPKDTQDAVQSTALRLRPGTVYGLFNRLGQCMHTAVSCAIGKLMMMHMWLADWLAGCLFLYLSLIIQVVYAALSALGLCDSLWLSQHCWNAAL